MVAILMFGCLTLRSTATSATSARRSTGPSRSSRASRSTWLIRRRSRSGDG